MNNTLEFPSPTRQRLIAICVCFVICAIAIGACAILIKDVDKHNLDGRTLTISGTVTDVDTDDCQDVTIQQNDGSKIVVNFLPFTGYLEDTNDTDEEQSIAFVQQLLGKTVSVEVPASPWDDDNLWVLGATVDGVEIADKADVIADKRTDNDLTYKILFAITVAFGVAACVFFIVRVNAPQTKLYPISEKYAEFFAEKQPLSPSRKRVSLISFVLCIVLLLGCIGLAFVPDDNENAMFVASMIFLGLLVAALATIIIGEVIATKMDIDFYVQNYPFDFNNVDHLRMNKKDKEQLAKDMQRYKERHPDTYGEGGNAFDVQFTPDGVNLYRDNSFYEEELRTLLMEDSELRQAFEEAFAEQQQQYAAEHGDSNAQTDADVPSAGAVFSLYPNCDDWDDDSNVGNDDRNDDSNVNADGDSDHHRNDDNSDITADGGNRDSVLGNAAEQNANATPFGNLESLQARFERKPVLSLTYEQLNLELVPYYFVGMAQQQKRPLVAVVKSRISDEVKQQVDMPEYFVHDLHMLFDLNMLDTLVKFNVPIEGVDELLSNKKQLILANRHKKK